MILTLILSILLGGSTLAMQASTINQTEEVIPSIKRGYYQHYKGMNYEVLGLCRHSETLEYMVMYKALYGDFGTWVRPYSMFCETVTINGQTIPRFKFIKEIK